MLLTSYMNINILVDCHAIPSNSTASFEKENSPCNDDGNHGKIWDILANIRCFSYKLFSLVYL